MPDFSDEAIQHIWDYFTDQLADEFEVTEFTEGVEDWFVKGYVDMDVDSDERAEAREQFEMLLEEYLLDISDFDWDEWRDWYASQ